jgi:aminopeptidase N
VNRRPYLAPIVVALLAPPVSAHEIGPSEPAYRYYNEGKPDAQFGRDRDIDVAHQAIDIRVDLEERAIEGTTWLRFTPIRATDRVMLNAGEMEIRACRLLGPGDAPGGPSQGTAAARSGLALSWEPDADTIAVALGRTIAAGESATIAIDYAAHPRKGFYFRDPAPGSANKSRSVFSQGETETNHYWFPSRDFPDDRASSEVIVTVRRPYRAISNGDLVSVRENADGTRTFHWSEKVAHTTYLTSLVVGDYEEVTLPVDPASASKAPLYAYGYPGDRERLLFSLRKTGKMIAFFERATGRPYPYERYAQTVVTRFVVGGMENIGATTLNEWTLHAERHEPVWSSDQLVAHEAAHQWFGDWITCRNWSHIWLNEGFASFFEHLFAEDDLGKDEMQRRRLQGLDSYLRAAGRFRRSLVVHNWDEGEQPFDAGHAYTKGSLVLHLLRSVLGDDAFFAGIRAYVARHGGGLVETADFRRAMEDATGKDLGLFFREWVESPGHPEVSVAAKWDREARLVSVRVEQTQRDDGKTPLFHFPLDVTVVPAEGAARATTHRFEVTRRNDTFHIPLDARPRFVVVDPEANVLGVLDVSASREEWRRALREAPTAAGRARAARALVESGAGPEDVDSLVAALRGDPFWWVRAEAARALEKAPGARSEEALVAALGDGDARVRLEAIDALGAHPTDRVARALLTAMRSDASDSARGLAAATLGKVVRAIGLASPAANAAPEITVDEARDALGSLLRVTSHRDAVPAGALSGLAALRDRRAVDRILEATAGGRNDQLRLAAVSSLGRAGGAFADDEAPDLRDRAYTRLAALLDDGFFRVRGRAIDALGELGDARALAPIDACVAREWEGDFKNAGRDARKKIAGRAEHTADALDAVREEVRRLEREKAALQERVEAIEKRLEEKGARPEGGDAGGD